MNCIPAMTPMWREHYPERTSMVTLLPLAALFFLSSVTLTAQTGLSVIPRPSHYELRDGSFRLDSTSVIVLQRSDRTLRTVAEGLARELKVLTGYRLPIFTGPRRGKQTIILSLDHRLSHLGREGYRLEAAARSIDLRAWKPAGVFYGVQTLLQLFPPMKNNGSYHGNIVWSVPAVVVVDTPRFPWRGMHLDVGRHFFPKEFIKRYIDLLASYKMNTFHWHLTEDQGWRLEIKRYPRLTSVGSGRRETMGDSVPHGGFYTQSDVREIVRYARDRFVTIVPEIEMPGHSLAALAAYPGLSCTGGPFEPATTWGVFDDVYCAGKERTFTFLKHVLTEIIGLFPGPYVHIGGDECPKSRWKSCPDCRKRIRANGLKDEYELQGYFIKRIEKFLETKGRRLVGWDEILEGGLPPAATVMSWRGMTGGIAAARSGHDVVMTPTSHCYFDYYQAKWGEPKAIGGYLPLDTVYAFEPVPPDLTPEEIRHILGAQGNVWTEWMPTTPRVEYMVLPRLCAMSEVVWSPRSVRNFENFTRRLEEQYDRFSAKGLNFRVPTPAGLGGKRVIFGDTLITLVSPTSTASIYYNFDSTDPTTTPLRFDAPIPISKDRILRTVVVLRNGRMSNEVATYFYRVDPRVNGLNYKYYEGRWMSLPDPDSSIPVHRGRAYDIALDAIPHRPEYYGVLFSGLLVITDEGIYRFFLTSDDGSKLIIDTSLVVDNDGLHATQERSGTVFLTRGEHRMAVMYFQSGGGSDLDLSIEGPLLAKRPIPPSMFRISDKEQ